jgi:hypothetical protein
MDLNVRINGPRLTRIGRFVKESKGFAKPIFGQQDLKKLRIKTSFKDGDSLFCTVVDPAQLR